MALLKEKWNVWTMGENDPWLKPFLSLLEDYGIKCKQGWIERVAHPDELFPIPEDYKAQYTVLMWRSSCWRSGGPATRSAISTTYVSAMASLSFGFRLATTPTR